MICFYLISFYKGIYLKIKTTFKLKNIILHRGKSTQFILQLTSIKAKNAVQYYYNTRDMALKTIKVYLDLMK